MIQENTNTNKQTDKHTLTLVTKLYWLLFIRQINCIYCIRLINNKVNKEKINQLNNTYVHRYVIYFLQTNKQKPFFIHMIKILEEWEKKIIKVEKKDRKKEQEKLLPNTERFTVGPVHGEACPGELHLLSGVIRVKWGM